MSTLHDVQQEVEHLIKDEWHSHYWSPLSSLARLTEEVGELAREINHRYGEKPKKSDEEQKGQQEQDAISGEMGDILFILASLANSIDVDLGAAFDGVMAKYRQRDSGRWTDQHDSGQPGSGRPQGSPLL